MQFPKLEIRNIKGSYVLEKDMNISFDDKRRKKLIVGKLKNNSVVTIYPNNKRLINVTGIRKGADILLLKDKIESQFNVKIKSFRIDSMMLSRKIENTRFSLRKVMQCLESHKNYKFFKLDYNPESFHSPWYKSGGDYGSFNIFSTGSVTAMGVKTIEGIQKINEMLTDAFCEENMLT